MVGRGTSRPIPSKRSLDPSSCRPLASCARPIFLGSSNAPDATAGGFSSMQRKIKTGAGVRWRCAAIAPSSAGCGREEGPAEARNTRAFRRGRPEAGGLPRAGGLEPAPRKASSPKETTQDVSTPSVRFGRLHDLGHGYRNGEFEPSGIEIDLRFVVQGRCNQAAPETLLVRSLDAGSIPFLPGELKPRLIALPNAPLDHEPSIVDRQ